MSEVQDLLKSRYYQSGESDWEDIINRVIQHLYWDYNRMASLVARHVLERKEFIPSSPVLMNAGTRYPMMCSCFVLPVSDSLPEIMRCLDHTAQIQKFGGGVGINFSAIRADGLPISSTGGVASGPVSFMGLWNALMNTIKQAGKRQGAMMGVLNWNHPDFELFLRAKREEGQLTNFNLSAGITNDTPEDVIRHIAEFTWINGEPGLVFLDNINLDNPFGSKIEATNPCGEQPLPPYGACCLGSINLKPLIRFNGDEAHFDFDYLEGVLAPTSVNIMNRVLDTSWWPLPEIMEFEARHRPIGIGVMGLSDVLIALGKPYGSKEALDFIDALFMSLHRGTSLASEGNKTLLSIAPTGSIAMMAGASYSIEPPFNLSGVKKVEIGSFKSENSLVDFAARAGGYKMTNKDWEIIRATGSARGTGAPDEVKAVLRTATEISPAEHLHTLKAVQSWVDSGVSKTVNLPYSTSPEEIADYMLWARDNLIKGVTFYRSGSREDEVMECPTGTCEL
jgi:ribonucleoside-diphosphate reductase alpha chain